MKTPIYEFLIDENDEIDGVKTISLVGHPAMESKFLVFDKNQPKDKYIFLEKDDKAYKGIVAGLSMIPDKLIYRSDEEGEYFGYFSVETIEKIRNKYHKELMTNNVNLEHNAKDYIDAYLVESYLLDTQDRVDEVKAKGIADAVLGSWFTAFKIEDKEAFSKAVNGEFTGFSIECFLNRELRAMAQSNKNNNESKIKKMKKNLVERIKERINVLLKEINFETALVPELNITLEWTEVGEAVTKTYMDENDAEVIEPVGQGEFVIEDGRTIVTDENSALVEIRDAVEAPAEVPVEEVPVEVPEEELEAPVEEVPAEVPVEAPATPDLGSKTIGEVLGDLTKDGEYSIKVSVEGGVVTSAVADSSQVLVEQMSAKQSEIDVLKAEIEALKVKLSAPIAEPVLKDREVQGETKVLTVYEKVASRRNLPLV